MAFWRRRLAEREMALCPDSGRKRRDSSRLVSDRNAPICDIGEDLHLNFASANRLI
jgi:hypothetical protein